MRYIILLILAILAFNALAQNPTGLSNDLDGNSLGWHWGYGYKITTPRATDIRIDENSKTGPWQTFTYTFSALDLTQNPFLQLKIWTSSPVKVRIDLQDGSGNVANKTPILMTLQGDQSYNTYTYDFTGKFQTNDNVPKTVNAANITGILVYLNPGDYFQGGYVYFDDLRIGSNTTITPPAKQITLNQIGFYPNLTKIGVVAQSTKNTFYIVSSDKQDTVYTGTLSSSVSYPSSGEKVQKADFTTFKTPGSNYYLTADSVFSFPFSIEDNIHHDLAKGMLKSYYLNRASIAIDAAHGGKWSRAKGHPDNQVSVHSSAAYAGRPVNTVFSSPRGWYDAGDYNKYVVNSGISTYTMLALYEHYPTFFDTLNTNIPESDNQIPDILDEALWNVRWLFTTQAPDGSVYHKITSLNFCGDVMPSADPLARYAVYRSTAAALDFAAVMAQSYRIFKNYPIELPLLADSCINAALLAYDWAVKNPNIIVDYNNGNGGNPAGVNTGPYADGSVSDEFAWARMELYAATRNDAFYNNTYRSGDVVNVNFRIPGWSTVNTLGLMTLVNYRKQLNTNGYKDTAIFKTKLINLATGYKNNLSAYGTMIGTSDNDFFWGSNAYAGNEGVVLLQAFRLTNDSSFLKAALSNLDYLLGRNAANYSFITGFGSKSPMNPHHRISDADGIAEPIPGMLVGGPNGKQDDGCLGYLSGSPAKSYADNFCSYASNEPAINYTASGTYLAAAFEGIMLKASFVPEFTNPPANLIGPLGTVKSVNAISVDIYPNPSKGEFLLEFKNKGTAKIQVSDVTGKVVLEETIVDNSIVSKPINISFLPEGIYMIVITNDEGGATKKIVKQ